jgi:hypothetical protein
MAERVYGTDAASRRRRHAITPASPIIPITVGSSISGTGTRSALLHANIVKVADTP